MDNNRLSTKRNRRQRAFTLLEVMVAMGIFLMMTLLFAAAFPLVTTQAHAGNNNDQAAMIAQHKLDQLRSAGFTVLEAPNGPGGNGTGQTTLNSLGIIDGSASSNSVPYTADFTTVDNLASTGAVGSGYYPPGATGTIKVIDADSVAAPKGSVGLASTAGCMYLVQVTVTWPGAVAVGGSYTASTIIAEDGGK